MGVCFELVLGDTADITNLITFTPLPPTDLISTKVLDQVTLAQLQVIIQRCSFATAIASYDIPVFGNDTLERWLYQLPDAFISRLALLDDAERQQAAHDWAHTEELQCRKVDEPWVQILVADMQKLAALAKQTGKTVYLRISL